MILADEPGSWEARGGALMWDAIRTALGKRPGQRLLLIGTRAPAEAGSWWPDLIDGGSGPGTHVTELSAPSDLPWDAWGTIRKVNPLVRASASLRRTILRERDDARRAPTLRAAFEAYRLNRQVAIGREVLVSLEDWQRALRRPVPPREGSAIVALDLGAERSWSAAWCLWENGRSECYAVCPGIPDLKTRERQDAQPRGIYQRLYNDGVLLVDEGLRVSRPETLIGHLLERGITPSVIFADRFVLGTLRDAVQGRWPIVARRTRWSEASEDIASFRKLVRDGPLSIVEECRGLAALGLAEAAVRGDDQGSVRIIKYKHRRSRDDVAVAAVLAAARMSGHLAVPGRSCDMRSRRLPTQEWARLRRAVLHRDDYKCVQCSKAGGHLEVDHRTPLHLGGSNEMENLQTLCAFPCHIAKTRREKYSQTPGKLAWVEFLAKLGGQTA